VIAQEASVQAHLLVASFVMAVARRHGADTAATLCARQLTGVAGAVARRLVAAFDLQPDAAGMAQLLALHPAFSPAGYVAWSVTAEPPTGPARSVRCVLGDCPALHEPADLPGGGLSWPRLLVDNPEASVDVVAAVARALDPRAVVERSAPAATDPVGTVAAWSIATGDTAHDEHPDVTLTRFSTGADFTFVRIGRRPGGNGG